MPPVTVGSESLTPSQFERDAEATRSFRPKRVTLFLAIAATSLLCSGSFDSIIGKFMNKTKLPPAPGADPVFFEAPWLQTWTMYLGEFLCLVVYYLDSWCAKRRGTAQTFEFPTSAKSFNKPPAPVWIWLIPMSIDFAASTMINYAFVFAQASTVQMLRNFNVILTAFLTLCYLRTALRVHQWVGVIIITVGMILVGMYALLYPDTETNYHDKQWLGLFMALVGTALSAFQFVFEESIFRKYSCSPFKGVGLMGLYGSILGGVLLLIFYLAGKVEDVKGTFYMMSLPNRDSRLLILANVSYVVSISIFNGSGLMITKLGSGLLRVVLNTARTFTIWLIELLIGWNKFTALNFVGLMVIIVGVFEYNYNYFLSKDSWSGDKYLRKPLVCFCVKDPDAQIIEEEIPERSADISVPMAVKEMQEDDTPSNP